MCKLKILLRGLKQSLRVWFERLTKFIIAINDMFKLN